MAAVPNNQPQSDALLTLITLGGASLARANIPILGPGKPLALVTYLALAPGRSATREFLLDLLWADLDHDRARHALRQTAWHLRQALGEGCLTGREEVTLGLVLDTDRDRFVKAIESGDPERALGLYAGPFLPAFALPGSSEFEHWADTERNRLRAMFLRAAETVARRRLAAGRFRDAQDLARRMRDTEPLNEIGWRLLLESLIAGRDLLQAAVEADALGVMHIAEHREPEPATRAVLASLKTAAGDTATADPGAPTSLVAELVGREREFALLLDGWNAATKGTFQHFHLSAPAGLGKTRLLGELDHRLRSLGARVIRLRANPGDRSVAYALAGDAANALGALPGLTAVSPGAADVLVSLSPALAARFPNANATRPTAEPLRLRTGALVEAVSAVAFEQPVALLIDDTHWLDAESRQVLDGVLHRISKAPILVVTTGRPSAGRPLAAPDTTLIELAPLQAGDVRLLLQSLGQFPDPVTAGTIATRLHRATAGSPLLVLEAIQLALERGTAQLADGLWIVPSLDAFLAELDRGGAITTRLSQLGVEESWILVLLATAGTPLSTDELRRGLRSPAHLDEQLYGLERRGLIRRTAEAWEPAHDEIGAAVLDGSPNDQRGAAHRAVGTLLATDGPLGVERLLEVCRHFAASDSEPELREAFQRAVRTARASGDPRSDHALAAAAIGEQATPESVRRLRRSLSWRVRWRLHSPARLTAAALTAVGVLAAGVTVLRAGPNDDAVLWAITADSTNPGQRIAYRVAWNATPWRAGQPLRAGARRTIPDGRLRGEPAIDSAGRWFYPVAIDNERTDDLAMWDGQAARVIYSHKRDDASPMPLLDGVHVAFLTAQFSPRGADDYDLALLNLIDSSVTRLTTTSDHDWAPVLSPFTNLIAFVRRPLELGPESVCWVTARLVDPVEHCVPVPELAPNGIVGWLDPSTVLFRDSRGAQTKMVRWYLATDTFEPLPWSGVASGLNLSPDGQWASCLCANSPAESPRWVVFPALEPHKARPIEAGTMIGVGWERRLAARPSTIRTLAPASITIGASHRLSAVLLDTNGTAIWAPTEAIRWSVGDTTVATIEPTTGTIRGTRLGTTHVRVLWDDEIEDTVSIRVSNDTASTLLREQWDALDTLRWAPFGEPRPRLSRAIDERAGLNNGGDGSYPSGVFSHESWTAVRGLGIEVELSAPVSRGQWQDQHISLATTRLHDTGGWDRRTGSVPHSQAAFAETCGFAYPGGEGMVGVSRFTTTVGGAIDDHPVDSTWRLGAWHTIRIQMFPDGSCGIAVDGIPISRPNKKVPVDQPYRLWLQGGSAGTDKSVFGPVTVWQGVRFDVNWARLDSLHSKPR